MKNKSITTITIKGTIYDIQETSQKRDYLGITKPYNKQIAITLDAQKQNVLEETIAHELFHAYMFECGHDEYYNDERLTHAFGRFAKELIDNYFTILKTYQNKQRSSEDAD